MLSFPNFEAGRSSKMAFLTMPLNEFSSFAFGIGEATFGNAAFKYWCALQVFRIEGMIPYLATIWRPSQIIRSGSLNLVALSPRWCRLKLMMQ